MLQYGVRKLAHTLLVALGVVTLVFAALRLSGDPAATMLPGDASVDELVALRKTLGLDRPIPVQYVSWSTSWWRCARRSASTGRSRSST
ncbi:MAG: hypothetical protein AUG80_12795 [Candidatus Rokubacteria bacterium 13_1_20CM_4_68_9]|nr:MAG: hypothetical protein AUG80_12795 [Candidatus Rokubacteria bacterium 13_1_20CM_4_68_9]